MLRSLSLLTLALCFAGCGKTPAPTVPVAEPTLPEVPAAPKAAHEMDPAKQTVPKTPASGMLGGKAFTPDKVTLGGRVLTFRAGAEFFADAEIALFLADALPNAPFKLTVKPEQKWHEGIPSLHVSQKAGAELPKTDFVKDGYALTLELSPRANGKIAGSLYLSLPGADKSFFAGTFTALYERELNDPPEPEDRPFVAGKINHSGKPEQTMHLRIAGIPTGKPEPISDGVGSKLGKGQFFSVRSTSFAPRVTSLRPGKTGEEYDCARLPPGRYFVMARIDNGPAGWKLVELAADSALDAPITIPTGATGSIEVAVPGTAGGQVQAIPAELKLDDPTGTFTTAISGALGAFDTVAGGKATLKNLAPGKYLVSLRSGTSVLRGEVEVESGKAAKVELK